MGSFERCRLFKQFSFTEITNYPSPIYIKIKKRLSLTRTCGPSFQKLIWLASGIFLCETLLIFIFKIILFTCQIMMRNQSEEPICSKYILDMIHYVKVTRMKIFKIWRKIKKIIIFIFLRNSHNEKCLQKSSIFNCFNFVLSFS